MARQWLTLRRLSSTFIEYAQTDFCAKISHRPMPLLAKSNAHMRVGDSAGHGRGPLCVLGLQKFICVCECRCGVVCVVTCGYVCDTGAIQSLECVVGAWLLLNGIDNMVSADAFGDKSIQCRPMGYIVVNIGMYIEGQRKKNRDCQNVAFEESRSRIKRLSIKSPCNFAQPNVSQ